MAVAAVSDALAGLGFARKNRTWNRRVPGFIDVIDLQVAKGGGRCTMNVAVLDPDVYFLFWGDRARPFVQEVDCTARSRIGSLIDDHDHWWDLLEPADAEQLRHVTTTYALPFLDRMHSRVAIEEWLIGRRVRSGRYPPPAIYLALLRSLRGDREAACTMLHEVSNRRQALGETR